MMDVTVAKRKETSGRDKIIVIIITIIIYPLTARVVGAPQIM